MSLVNLLSAGPGVFVYHLLIFMVLEAVIGIALIEYRRTRDPDHRRIAWAFGGLMGMRVLLLIGEPLGPDVIAPILNGIELASLTLLGWAFLTPFLDLRASRGYLFGGLGITVLCAVTFLPGWYEMLARFPNLLYFPFWQQTLWYVVDTLLALTPTLILLRLRQNKQPVPQLSPLAFGTLTFGFATLCISSFCLTVGWLDVAAYTLIGFGRMINLIGYPLFAIVVHQAVLRDPAHRGAKPGARQTPTLQSLAGAGQTPDLDDLVNQAVKEIATILDADLCAIFLINSKGTPGAISLTAQYAPRQGIERPISPFTFLLDEQPALAYALQRRKQLVFNVETDNPRLQTLYRRLGSQRAGPTVIQPILDQQRALGVLVIGNNHSQRAFDPDAIRTCQQIAGQIAAILPEKAHRR